MENPISNRSDGAKKLSILIAQDGLSFCVCNDSRIFSFTEEKFSSPQDPEELLKTVESFFNYSFRESRQAISAIKVFYAHSLYTLVPRELFDQHHLSDYLKFNTKLLPTDELSVDRLKKKEANLVFIPFININNYLFDKFGEFTYQHLTSHFVDFTQRRREAEGQHVFVNVFRTHFDLCMYQDGQLLLCNSYAYYAPEDFVYYLLYAVHQLNFDRDVLQLFLFGAIEKEDKTFELLAPYLRHITLEGREIKREIETESAIKGKPAHHSLFLNAI